MLTVEKWLKSRDKITKFSERAINVQIRSLYSLYA